MILKLLKTAAVAANENGGRPKKKGLFPSDLDILLLAEITEALAVTAYTHIINDAPFFYRFPSERQSSLITAREEEMAHYAVLESITGAPAPCTAFHFPAWMFKDAQSTLNLLVTLEDFSIAVYLLGVRNFSTSDLRVTAARIMGVECAHRALARVVGPDVSKRDGGPLHAITGAEGVAEKVIPANNGSFARTLKWLETNQIIDALLPFVDTASAAKAGFETSRHFAFKPFKPALPSPWGDFISSVG